MGVLAQGGGGGIDRTFGRFFGRNKVGAMDYTGVRRTPSPV